MKGRVNGVLSRTEACAYGVRLRRVQCARTMRKGRHWQLDLPQAQQRSLAGRVQGERQVAVPPACLQPLATPRG